jgi:hypothetical protein
MGYYSNFEVDGTDIPFVADVLNGVSGYYWDVWQENVTLSSSKWYAWLTDLQEVAKLYPNNYLIILRYGEESGDISRALVQNGTVVEQRATLSWPETDLNK